MSVTIHDHFDGSAHCVECQGPCRLQGDDKAVTNLVRWTLEFAAGVHKGWMWGFTEDSLRRLLGPLRLSNFQRRAAEADQRTKELAGNDRGLGGVKKVSS